MPTTDRMLCSTHYPRAFFPFSLIPSSLLLLCQNIIAFGLYSSELKETLQLSQSQLNTLSSANFCAGLVTWIPGLMVDHCGVRWSLSMGGFLGATFMMIYWAVARQFISFLPTWMILPTLCVLGALIFMANGLVTGSIFKLLVATCAPHTKGSIVGAAKGYVGLGSGVYACLFRALKTPLLLRDLDFLPLAALLVLLAGSLPALLLLPNKAQLDQLLETTPRNHLDQMTTQHLRFLYVGLLGLASIVVGTTVASLADDRYTNHGRTEDDKKGAFFQGDLESENPQSHYGHAIVILIAWIGPIVGMLVLPPKSKWLHDNNNKRLQYEQVDEIREYVAQLSAIDEHDAEEEEDNYLDERYAAQQYDWEPLTKTTSSPALAYGAEITESIQKRSDAPRGLLGAKVQRSEHVPPPNFTLTEMLQTWPAWLFLWVASIRVGGGTMVTNNMGQMVESLYLPMHSTIPASLALFSVSQAVSRVVTGALSDSALSWNIHWGYTQGNIQYELQGIPRPAFLIVASCAGVMAHIFLSFTTTRNFFLLGVCLAGAAFGMIWPLMVCMYVVRV
jgi:Nodulin-like